MRGAHGGRCFRSRRQAGAGLVARTMLSLVLEAAILDRARDGVS